MARPDSFSHTVPRTSPTRRFAPWRFLWRLFLAFIQIMLLLTLLLTGTAAWIYHRYAQALPDPQQIGRHHSFETTRIFANDGETLLYELVDPQAGHRTVVPFERIPQILKDATIAVEDANFYTNPGVDVRGIVRALWLNYRNQEVVSGGSTITQQLVRSILLTPQERTEISYDRKLREAILAYQVSQEYSKDQILGIYLNEVYYGAQAYGVEAAARRYFGKHVWELSLGEATLLAGLPQSPSQLDLFQNLPGARARQRITLDLMVKYGYLTTWEADGIFTEQIHLVDPDAQITAPHFVFYVRDILEQRYGTEVLYQGGLRVTTSLDLHWQDVAQRLVQQHIRTGAQGNPPLSTRNATNAAVVMLAPDGQILAMVGSVDYTDPTIDGQVNVALAARQPGSALKPLVYAAAFQRGWTPATVIWDEPVRYDMPGGVTYAPLNYDNAWHGPQRVRMALANSLNIPAVKALEFVGVENFVELATRMGLTTFDDPARYGLSMALGSGEVRLLELSGAYNTLRNGGIYHTPSPILSITNSRGEVLERRASDTGRQVLGEHGEAIAFLITSILSDNQARWYMFGRGNVMELADGRPAAVKTGTSNDWRDSWALGYTPDVTIGVWVGNSNNAPMQEVAGANGAGEIWRDLIETYHQDRPPRSFERPLGIVEQSICADTGGMAGVACPRPITEFFIAGSEPRDVDITYQSVRVVGNGACLAASYTPISEIRTVTYAIYPGRFRDWAVRNGVPQPPTHVCPPPQDSHDQAVAWLAPISDTGDMRVINGTARYGFRLEVGAGSDPQQWQLVSQGIGAVENSLLGIWHTSSLTPGDYTLRLLVTTPEGLTVIDSQVVRLGA